MLGITDRPPAAPAPTAALRVLSTQVDGKGAFRRFRNELYQHNPELISAWQSFRDARARVRAVRWLVEQGLVEDEAARRFTSDPPERALP